MYQNQICYTYCFILFNMVILKAILIRKKNKKDHEIVSWYDWNVSSLAAGYFKKFQNLKAFNSIYLTLYGNIISSKCILLSESIMCEVSIGNCRGFVAAGYRSSSQTS